MNRRLWHGLLFGLIYYGTAQETFAQRDVLDNIAILGSRALMNTPGIEAAEGRPEVKQPSLTYEKKLPGRSAHMPLEARSHPEEASILMPEHPLLTNRNESLMEAARTRAFAPRESKEAVRLPKELTPPELDALGEILDLSEDTSAGEGMTLENAVDLLIRSNRELRTLAHEIPQAQADVLTAGLRQNPLVFWNAGDIPYGKFSTQEPGYRSYPLVLVYSVDLTGRRRARMRIAQEAQREIEARYQNAVRLKVVELQGTFVEGLVAQAEVQAVRAALDELEVMVSVACMSSGPSKFRRLISERNLTAMALRRYESRLQQSKRELTSMLDLPRESIFSIALSGNLIDRAPAPPQTEDLVKIALTCRPDLAAQRLSIRRSQELQSLEQSRWLRDTYLLYEPWGGVAQGSGPNRRFANVWSVGLFMPVPLFDRNQGNIERSKIEVSKMASELNDQERRVVSEVEEAAEEYLGTGKDVEQIERDLLPLAWQERKESKRRFASGETNELDYLNVLREYHSIARQYRDAVSQHRHSMLRLNAAVGYRVLP